jgi:hypothetical protein
VADKKISDGALRDSAALASADVFEVELVGTAVQYYTRLSDIAVFALQGLVAQAEIDDPAEGEAGMWLSNGTGAGDAGDVLIKITSGGVTKTIALIDFSAVPSP